MASSPLEGLKVLDLTQLIAGPYCTRLFALCGAEVIKVERPGIGDPARRVLLPNGESRTYFKTGLLPHPEGGGMMPPPSGGGTEKSFETGPTDLEHSPLFLYLNTGKRSLTLNVKVAPGREVFLRLAAWADVLVENLRPGALERLGLGYPSLAEINPRLVMCSITNFGRSGPYRDYRAYEINLQAWAGLMHITGDSRREPLRLGFPVAQYLAGQNAFAASLAALLAREWTGQGQHVDISIADCLFATLEASQAQYAYNQEVRGRTGHTTAGGWGTYRVKDGYAAVVTGNFPDAAPRLAELVGDKRLLDPRFRSREGRARYQPEVDAILEPWLADRTKREVFEEGQRHRLPFGYLCTLEDVLHLPQLETRQFFVELDHPLAGRHRYPGAPFQMGSAPLALVPAPTLGQHTAAVLRGLLGYPEAQVAAWRREGVV